MVFICALLPVHGKFICYKALRCGTMIIDCSDLCNKQETTSPSNGIQECRLGMQISGAALVTEIHGENLSAGTSSAVVKQNIFTLAFDVKT